MSSQHQSGITINYYYQHIQHGYLTGVNPNVYTTGYYVENMPTRQAPLTQGEPGRVEEMIDQVEMLDREAPRTTK